MATPDIRVSGLHREDGAAGTAPAFWAKGFRPFFWLAAAFSASGMALWLAALFLGLDPGGVRGAMYWHAHEMTFGFTAAVLAGFLLTAVANWTGQETATGGWLAAMAGAWVAGRLAMLAAGDLDPVLVAAADLSFLPMVIVAVGRPIVATRNARNYLFIGLLVLLWTLNLSAHLAGLGVLPRFARAGPLVAVDVVTVVIVVITGRIVPMFTRNATGEQWIRGRPALDRLALLGTVALVVVDLAGMSAPIPGAVALAAAVPVALRTRHWGFRPALREPLLWILHAGHAWVVLGLLLRGASSFTSLVPEVLATHALTAGAIGSLTLGMMVRVGLGHTGRPLRVGPWITTAFMLVTISAVLRVLVPLVFIEAYRETLLVAGVAWTAAFGLYLVRHHGVLTEPRVDGRPG